MLTTKNSLLLSTLAVVMTAGVDAAQSSSNSTDNCTASYYPQIPAAFIDCVDSNGVL